MAIPTPTPAPAYSLSSIEAAGVAFAGSFAAALLVVGETITHAAIIGVLAAAVSLGYHAYQSS